MKRFAIEVVRGNSSRILATYDTKEQGYEVGKSYAQALAGEGGVIVLFYADFDKHNKPTSNGVQIFEIWNISKVV